MAQIYYERIIAGLMTIDEVPARWRSAVRELLDDDITDAEALRIILGEEE